MQMPPKADVLVDFCQILRRGKRSAPLRRQISAINARTSRPSLFNFVIISPGMRGVSLAKVGFAAAIETAVVVGNRG